MARLSKSKPLRGPALKAALRHICDQHRLRFPLAAQQAMHEAYVLGRESMYREVEYHIAVLLRELRAIQVKPSAK